MRFDVTPKGKSRLLFRSACEHIFLVLFIRLENFISTQHVKKKQRPQFCSFYSLQNFWSFSAFAFSGPDNIFLKWRQLCLGLKKPLSIIFQGVVCLCTSADDDFPRYLAIGLLCLLCTSEKHPLKKTFQMPRSCMARQEGRQKITIGEEHLRVWHLDLHRILSDLWTNDSSILQGLKFASCTAVEVSWKGRKTQDGWLAQGSGSAD